MVCAVETFKTLLFVQSRHSKLCLCSRDIQNFIVCAIATFKTLLFVQWRHSKLYCLCNRDIQNFIVCAIATFKTLLFVQSSHSKLFSLRVPSGAPYARKAGRGNEPVGSCAMRGVLGRERSRQRTVEKWRVKTKFCSTYKVHCYG